MIKCVRLVLFSLTRRVLHSFSHLNIFWWLYLWKILWKQRGVDLGSSLLQMNVCTKWWKLHYSQKFSVVLHSLTHLTSKQKSCVRSLNPANFHSNTTSPLLLNATFSSVPKNYQGMLFPCRKSHSFTDVWHKSFFKRVLRTLFFPISSKWVVD